MTEFKIGGKYNWKNRPERLVYMGIKLYTNGEWHQFSLIESPDKVWCEVRGFELSSFEETLQEPKGLTDTDLLNFLEITHQNNVFNIGTTWYSRQSYMLPHKKHKSLREAIKHAMGVK